MGREEREERLLAVHPALLTPLPTLLALHPALSKRPLHELLGCHVARLPICALGFLQSSERTSKELLFGIPWTSLLGREVSLSLMANPLEAFQEVASRT